MPLIRPRKNEERNSFVSRCMSDETMKKEYPDQEQRTAVCFSQWRKFGKRGVRGGDRQGPRNKPIQNYKLPFEK